MGIRQYRINEQIISALLNLFLLFYYFIAQVYREFNKKNKIKQQRSTYYV